MSESSHSMVTLLITSILFLGLIALAVYFWQKPSTTPESPPLPPPNARGLFETTSNNLLASRHADFSIDEIRTRASHGDKGALVEARQVSDEFYNETLNTLVDVANQGPALLALISYVTRHELRVNKKLAEAVMRSWRVTPDRGSTAKMLHIAALTDDANAYRNAVEVALGFWREGKIADLSAIEFQALLTGEFWVLSSGTRSSGAGFVLKRTLSSARREIEASNNEPFDTQSN